MSDTNTADAAFTESLAAAAAMETPNEAPSGDAAGGTDDDDGTESPAPEDGEEDNGEADDSDAADDDGDEESEESSDDSAAKARELFLAGDKAAAAKALGLDPKVFDLSDAKFRTMRQGLKAADEKLAEAEKVKAEGIAAQAKAENMYKQGKEELGPVLQLRRLLAKGDYLAAKDMLEALAPPGTTYQQIAEGIALAAKGMSPSEQLYRRRLRELDEKEQKEKAEKEKPPEKPAVTDPGKNLEGAKKMLANTALADIPNAAETLVRIAAENWDPVKKGFKVPRAELVKLVQKDPVISQLLELKQLRAKKGKAPESTPAAEATRDKKGRFQERSRERQSKLTPEQSAEAKREKDFRDSIAQAAAMERQERRRAGAGKGRR